MSFENLIGNEEVKELLNNTVKNNKILHSYLFYGPEGIGKKRFAEKFAKMILCMKKEENCNTCKSCIEFESGNHPDFFEILSENDSIKIETVRNMMGTVLEKPIVSNHKVYIIDNADSLTKEAQNCLLKTLEEPPSFVTIILITSNDSKLLTTIKSRCTKVLFQKIDDSLLENFLREQYGYNNLTWNLIESFQGSIKNAINIQENKDVYEELDKVFSNVENYTILDAINRLEVLYKNKENINDILDYIKFLFYQKIRSNFQYISYIEEIERTKKRLRANSNYEMCIDHLLFKIWEGNR